MKILVDETSDGWDIKLRLAGFDAYSVKKLRKEEEKLGHDFNVIGYARDNKMILITKDKETGRACMANNFPCIWINDNTIFEKMVLVEIEKLKLRDTIFFD